MSKPHQQPKSGARSKPPKKPQRHPPVQTIPPPRQQARLDPFITIVLAAIALGLLLFVLERSGRFDDLFIRIGWKSATPAIVEPAR